MKATYMKLVIFSFFPLIKPPKSFCSHFDNTLPLKIGCKGVN